MLISKIIHIYLLGAEGETMALTMIGNLPETQVFRKFLQ